MKKELYGILLFLLFSIVVTIEPFNTIFKKLLILLIYILLRLTKRMLLFLEKVLKHLTKNKNQ